MTTTATKQIAVQAGDFFYDSWGYDQTNVDFYKVISVSATGKTIKVQQWTAKRLNEWNGPHDAVVPGEGPVKGGWVRTDEGEFYDRDVEAPVETRRLRFYSDRPTFTVNSYSAAYHWDGTAQHVTGRGYGH